jgi:hypothetical protein
LEKIKITLVDSTSANKRGILIGMGVVLAALVVWLIIGVSGGPKEPIYQGKALSLWLEDYTPSGRQKAAEAVHSTGTNAIPILLKWMRAKVPPRIVLKIELKLIDLAKKQSMVRIHYVFPVQRNEIAYVGFQVLGTNAATAVPELMSICAEKAHPESQRYAALSLGYIGPAAKLAIPLLMEYFNHTNALMRFAAVKSVTQIGGDPKLVVPAMRKVLKDPDDRIRFNAVAALRNYIRSDAYSRSNVLSAVPELMEVLQDKTVPPDENLKNELVSALWDLVPEKIAKPLIVEDFTPMVTNGVTSETLYRREFGEMWALIPTGRNVRCAVYQSIANNPVYLFRGTNHFLGRFQVAEPATNTSVEIVYIIDAGQIRLCARDDGRKEFPALRRVEEEAEK